MIRVFRFTPAGGLTKNKLFSLFAQFDEWIVETRRNDGTRTAHTGSAAHASTKIHSQHLYLHFGNGHGSINTSGNIFLYFVRWKEHRAVGVE